MNKITRRAFLKAMAVSLLGAAAAGLLAGCEGRDALGTTRVELSLAVEQCSAQQFYNLGDFAIQQISGTTACRAADANPGALSGWDNAVLKEMKELAKTPDGEALNFDQLKEAAEEQLASSYERDWVRVDFVLRNYSTRIIVPGSGSRDSIENSWQLAAKNTFGSIPEANYFGASCEGEQIPCAAYGGSDGSIGAAGVSYTEGEVSCYVLAPRDWETLEIYFSTGADAKALKFILTRGGITPTDYDRS